MPAAPAVMRCSSPSGPAPAGLAHLNLQPGASLAAETEAASQVRAGLLSRDEARRAELRELETIYDMSHPHPVDSAKPRSYVDGRSVAGAPALRCTAAYALRLLHA